MIASGTFQVDLQPLDPATEGRGGITFGRLSIDKTFDGDLSAKSRGEMLTAMTGVSGSAGYVAVEQVDGTLHGRKGTFVLQHFGIMSQGHNHLLLQVVPDSGTGDLVGLSGAMTLTIQDGQHFYTLDYTLPGAPTSV